MVSRGSDDDDVVVGVAVDEVREEGEDEVEVDSSEESSVEDEDPEEDDDDEPKKSPPLPFEDELEELKPARAVEEPDEAGRVSPIEDDAPPLGRGFLCVRRRLRINISF